MCWRCTLQEAARAPREASIRQCDTQDELQNIQHDTHAYGLHVHVCSNLGRHATFSKTVDISPAKIVAEQPLYAENTCNGVASPRRRGTWYHACVLRFTGGHTHLAACPQGWQPAPKAASMHSTASRRADTHAAHPSHPQATHSQWPHGQRSRWLRERRGKAAGGVPVVAQVFKALAALRVRDTLPILHLLRASQPVLQQERLHKLHEVARL